MWHDRDHVDLKIYTKKKFYKIICLSFLVLLVSKMVLKLQQIFGEKIAAEVLKMRMTIHEIVRIRKETD